MPVAMGRMMLLRPYASNVPDSYRAAQIHTFSLGSYGEHRETQHYGTDCFVL